MQQLKFERVLWHFNIRICILFTHTWFIRQNVTVFAIDPDLFFFWSGFLISLNVLVIFLIKIWLFFRLIELLFFFNILSDLLSSVWITQICIYLVCFEILGLPNCLLCLDLVRHQEEVKSAWCHDNTVYGGTSRGNDNSRFHPQTDCSNYSRG